MERVRLGRDLGLSARMALACVFLLGVYLCLFAVPYVLYRLVPAAWPYWAAAALALAVSVNAHVGSSERRLLETVGARHVGEREEPELTRALVRLAALADVPAPELAIADSRAANAFVVGLSRGRTTLVVTRGLLDRLTAREVEAVLAHELTHVINRDSVVMTAAAGPRTAAAVLIASEGWSWIAYLIWPIGLPIYWLGSLASLSISRYREFAADRGSALLTGAPEQLMSALQKLADLSGIPQEDLRRFEGVEALCIVPNQPSGWTLFLDHPPLERRLEALAAIARRLGKVVPRWA